MSADIAAGRPVVIHVVVALCDNENQGIVPVPENLGNGQNPNSNLYWGALYGLRTHFPRLGGWQKLSTAKVPDERILERAVLFKKIKRNEAPVPVYVVPDAWDGAQIQAAIARFPDLSAGIGPGRVRVNHNAGPIDLQAGGSAHLITYVGHNGLMEFSLDSPAVVANHGQNAPRSCVVLACASRGYFLRHLEATKAHALLLTTGLMAPEAYTLDAVIGTWVGNGSTARVIEAAAQAYNQYQKCGVRGAQRLFWGSSP